MAQKTWIILLIYVPLFLRTTQCYGAYFDFAKTLQTFDCSLVNIINYGNMDFGPLLFPTVIVQYILQSRGGFLFALPTELKNDPIQNRTRLDLFKNLELTEIASVSKQWYCQVHVYLGLDLQTVPKYTAPEVGTTIPKFLMPSALSQFWTKKDREGESHGNSREAYNILIYSHDKQINLRILRTSWLLSVLVDNRGYYRREYFVWKIEKKQTRSLIIAPSYIVTEYYHMCHHCVPCTPYFSNVLLKFPQNKAQLNSYINNVNNASPKLWFIFPQQKFLNVFGNGGTLHHLSETGLMFRGNYIKNLHISLRVWYIHGAFLNTLLPNSSFIHLNIINSDGSSTIQKSPFVYSITAACGEGYYHWKTLPVLSQYFGGEMAYYPLTLPKESLKFLSCGKLTKSFFHPLLELFTAFDWESWCAILTMVLALSFTISKVNHFDQKLLKGTVKTWKPSFCSQLFLIFACFLDQYSNLVGTKLSQVRCFKWIATFPFVFLILSNAYKGENIVRLTVPNDIIPMDTFERLVENSFKIYDMPTSISGAELAKIKNLNETLNFTQISRHEAYPIVSQIWLSTIVRLESRIATLKKLGNRVSAKTWFYLNNTQLFPIPNWNVLHTEGYNAVIDKLVIPHLIKCERTAVLMPDVVASKLYPVLLKSKRFVYLVKDTISFPQIGYGLFNWFPQKILKRMNGLRDSGIVDWWDKFLNDDLFKPVVGLEMSNQSKSGSYVIFVVLLFGNGMSLIIFLFVEINQPMRVLSRDYYQRVTRALDLWKVKFWNFFKVEKQQLHSGNQQFILVQSKM